MFILVGSSGGGLLLRPWLLEHGRFPLPLVLPFVPPLVLRKVRLRRTGAIRHLVHVHESRE